MEEHGAFSTQIHQLRAIISVYLLLLSFFFFLWNIEFHMAGCESVIHLEISLYFHNKSLRLNKCSGQRVSYETLIVFVNAALLPSGGRERAGMISH